MTDRSSESEARDAIRPNPVESQLRPLLDTLPVGAYICNRDGLITYFNRRAVELWGRAPALNDPIDRFCGSSRLFDVDGTPVPHERCWMAAALQTGQEYAGHEIIVEREDGSRVNVLVHATPMRDEVGQVVGAINLLVDVTDRKRADNAQALLAAIVDSSNDAIVSKSLDGRIMSWNRGAERLFGYSADEAIGQPVTIIIPRDRLDEEHDLLQHIRQGQRVEHSETVRVAKGGRPIDVSVMVSPVRDVRGNVIGASAVTRDITARKRAEQALLDGEERFRTLADNIAQLAWMADETGSIFWYNKRWFDYTGSTAQEMLGWGWRSVHAPDHVDRVVEKFTRSIESGEIWEDIFPLRGSDGQYRWFLSRAIPIRDARGKVLRWFGTNTDITAQRDAEESLREADRRKDEFLAMLAHELRNPLAPITNSLHILRMAQDVDPAIEKIHEILERQTNHLARLVDDLLEVSRITQEKIELRTELIELAAVIRSAVETSRPSIDTGRHQLAISLPSRPMVLEADPIRLSQVIANLLNNAAKYTSEGGQIWLTAETIDAEAVIRVRDNGVGIVPEVLPRIFDKFAQVGGDDARLGGLGIGLTLARSLVELHGGRIEAHSEGRGKGSQFTIHLPLATQAPPIAPPHIATQAAKPPRPRRKILVVDDARDSAFILSKLLESLGHHVLSADNGHSAIELARRERPDVVISDIAMADMDGYELARCLRREPALAGVLLVALTGFGQERDRKRTSQAGFDQHLVKPVSLDELDHLFASLPERSKAPSA
jgi:PAS domain S-box-containing protein